MEAMSQTHTHDAEDEVVPWRPRLLIDLIACAFALSQKSVLVVLFLKP
jgi:hypothetical protein